MSAALVPLERPPIAVKPISPLLGAEISRVDLREALSADAVDAIRTALLKHKVLFFHDQDISREDHVRFGRYFGELEGHPVTTHAPDFPEILVIEAADGMKITKELLPIARPANKWHTDVTFREKPSLAGILRARNIPPVGGDTIFADTAAIYADLPDELKSRIVNLNAEHDIIKSYGYRVSEEKRAQLHQDYPPVAHPVVRRHPETGENHLFVNSVFTTRILGLEPKESDALLATLFDRVKAPEYQVRFRWSPNAIAFWDNRATQHYGVLDYWPFERVVERVTVRGNDRPSK